MRTVDQRPRPVAQETTVRQIAESRHLTRRSIHQMLAGWGRRPGERTLADIRVLFALQAARGVAYPLRQISTPQSRRGAGRGGFGWPTGASPIGRGGWLTHRG